MKSDLFIIGVLIVGCGVFAFTQILQRAQARLEPQLLASLVERGGSSWREFLVPLLPLFFAYLLVPRFPRYQALIAIPALLGSAALLFAQYWMVRDRVARLGLPTAFLAARRRANLVLAASLVAGMGLIYWARAT